MTKYDLCYPELIVQIIIRNSIEKYQKVQNRKIKFKKYSPTRFPKILLPDSFLNVTNTKKKWHIFVMF